MRSFLKVIFVIACNSLVMFGIFLYGYGCSIMSLECSIKWFAPLSPVTIGSSIFVGLIVTGAILMESKALARWIEGE